MIVYVLILCVEVQCPHVIASTLRVRVIALANNTQTVDLLTQNQATWPSSSTCSVPLSTNTSNGWMQLYMRSQAWMLLNNGTSNSPERRTTNLHKRLFSACQFKHILKCLFPGFKIPTASHSLARQFYLNLIFQPYTEPQRASNCAINHDGIMDAKAEYASDSGCNYSSVLLAGIQ